MLLRKKTLEAIVSGDVDLAFRRWKRPTVRAGGRLRTRVGELAIHAVDRVTAKSLTERDARRAGHASLADLREALRGSEGQLYRIRLSFDGEDSRVALRENAALTEAEFEGLEKKLAAKDRRSADGPWTRSVLQLLHDRPAVRAADLAVGLGQEKLFFKRRVRGLKELGLTESLAVGYRLSPRGEAVLDWLKRNG